MAQRRQPRPAADQPPNRYVQILERIFLEKFEEGAVTVPFRRADIVQAADTLGIVLPENKGDVIYSFRFRVAMPRSIREKAPTGKEWIIRLAGRGKYAFWAVTEGEAYLVADPQRAETKVPDSTPGIITMSALDDEQAGLAKIRYNRLIDLFTGVVCYSLQSHLRTYTDSLGQIETDEVYVGVDRRGAHYVFPVQAKVGRDRLGIVQVEQDLVLCAEKFPRLLCRPIGAQIIDLNVIAMFEIQERPEGLRKVAEERYRLVPPDQMTAADLALYRARRDD